MSSQNHLFRHLRPPKPSKGSTRNGLKNTLKIDAHFFSKSTKSVSKRDDCFRAPRFFFRHFSTLGPNGVPGLPQGGPGRHFDPILVTFSLFFAYFFTALHQAKETKSYTPAAKKGQHSVLFSRCKPKDSRWPQTRSAPKKGSIPPCFQCAPEKTSDGLTSGPAPNKEAHCKYTS